MFDGIIEINKSSYDKVIKKSNLLLHARIGYLNYNALHFLINNGVYGLSIIHKQRNKCDARILGEHISKHHFQESKFRACGKLELIHSDICNPMPIPSTNGNK